MHLGEATESVDKAKKQIAERGGNILCMIARL